MTQKATLEFFLSATSLLLLAPIVFGCSNRKSAPHGVDEMPLPTTVAVVFAADGFEWDILLPLVKAGKLPNLADLMERGCYGEIEMVTPTLSPVVWTTVATGKHHSKHGIHHFARFSRTGGPLRLYNNRDRKTKAVWNILSDYGRSVSSIGWWMTYPVEAVNGVMVAQTNTIEQLDTRAGNHVWKGALRPGIPGQVFPSDRQEHVFEILRDVEAGLPSLPHTIFGEFRHTLPPLDARLRSNCQWSFRADASYLQIALKLLQENPETDLTLVYFGGPDVVGHRFWRYMQPDVFRHRPTAGELRYDYSRLLRLHGSGFGATTGRVSVQRERAGHLRPRYAVNQPPGTV